MSKGNKIFVVAYRLRASLAVCLSAGQRDGANGRGTWRGPRGRMNQRSVLVGGIVCIGVFYALLTGDFIIILMSVIAGYVIHTLLS